VSPFETLRLAAVALSASRGRSALTVLSITIGAFAIVVMSSLAESGLLTLQHGIEELGGARIVFVAQKSPERGEAKQASYARGISLDDRERILRDLPHIVGSSMFSRLGKRDVLSETGARGRTDLVASDAAFFQAFHMLVARGRAFTDDESRARAPLCVVGHTLVQKLNLGDLLGHSLTVGPLRCRVAGVLADNSRFGVGFGFDWTDLVIVPLGTMGDLEDGVKEAVSVIVKTDDPGSNDVVKRMVNARMTARHPGVDDFTLFDFSTFMARFQKVFLVMELIVALLASIALVIGGVGVMNMMLVAVSERFKEIGIRKALGASPRDIGAQFLTEAVMLSTTGGAVGVGLGLAVALGASLLIARFLTTWQTSLAPVAAALALAVSLGIGAVFGVLPARRASRLDPVEAMRR
jgi:putative ABC transport system permease protein